MIVYDSYSGTCSCYCFDKIFSREILHIETFFLNCFNRYWSKNPHKQGGNENTRHCTESIYWKFTIDVQESIPVDFDFGIETCQVENDKGINEQHYMPDEQGMTEQIEH